jgi:hypothetical protein
MKVRAFDVVLWILIALLVVVLAIWIIEALIV